ncbi:MULTISPECIES: ATP-binding protein [Culturomica]|mgnify:FL=1|jgi:serine/threonine-protein kinase RsbW|uniref:ATP-binding protein n=1 Tax=Culturomica TaxID=1926651 RepID=UPI00033D8390|nr:MULTISPECIES: ATP-binding protein [Odoribacteraceae]RHV98066.1 ATP-binding protein [Odoribacter sp. OF09-27XD]CCZ08307.1 putative uncharacterized protein [Odoribacter sp. CAG:788]HBO25431.1 ATP-binding protein [Culturomica sp.]
MSKSELTIFSDLNNLPEVEDFIENLIDKFGIEENLRVRIMLPVIEAVNNAILFGNKKDSKKTVKLTAAMNNREMIITVEDEGEGFDFSHIPNPTTPENLMKTTGRGLYLMMTLTDNLLFTRNGAKVEMTFVLN